MGLHQRDADLPQQKPYCHQMLIALLLYAAVAYVYAGHHDSVRVLLSHADDLLEVAAMANEAHGSHAQLGEAALGWADEQ